MVRLKHQKSEKVKQISLSTTSARNSWLRHGVKTDTMHYRTPTDCLDIRTQKQYIYAAHT